MVNENNNLPFKLLKGVMNHVDNLTDNRIKRLESEAEYQEKRFEHMKKYFKIATERMIYSESIALFEECFSGLDEIKRE